MAADMRRFGFLDFLLLLVVFAVAGGVRAGYLMTCADNGNRSGPLRVVEPSPVVPDFAAAEGLREGEKATEQDVLIHNVRMDFWFASRAPFAADEETTAHVSPGFPYLVGVLSRYVPEDQAEFTVRWAQVGLGAFTAAFYFLFARRAFRSLMVGTLAGLFAAFHPFWVVEVANMNEATLASCALGLCLLLASQAGEKGGALKSLLLGASLAGLALVRAAFLPFSFVMLVWFLLRSRTLRFGWLCALCAFLGFGAALSPWTIRNYQEFNEPVPVVSSTYLHLWIGNNPLATGGPMTEEMRKGAPVAELQQIPGQSARYARLGRDVAQEVRDNPVRSIQRRLRAILMFCFGARWLADGTIVETTSEANNMPQWLQDAYPVTFPAVLFGLTVLTFLGWRWTYGWRWECIPAALAMMWVPLPYILGHAGPLSGERLPLDGVLLCLSAFALCCFLPGVGGHLLGGAESATTASAEESRYN